MDIQREKEFVSQYHYDARNLSGKKKMASLKQKLM